MKEMNEYTAEVLRRVETKKREQRNSRMRAAALCVPAVLVALTLAAVLPKWGNISSDGTMPGEPGSASPADPVTTETLPPDSPTSGGFIENDGISNGFGTDISSISRIEVKKLSIYAEPTMLSADSYAKICDIIDSAEAGEPLETTSDTPDPALSDGYMIILRFDSGESAEYELRKNYLTNKGTQQRFLLEEDDAVTLISIFEQQINH